MLIDFGAILPKTDSLSVTEDTSPKFHVAPATSGIDVEITEAGVVTGSEVLKKVGILIPALWEELVQIARARPV